MASGSGIGTTVIPGEALGDGSSAVGVAAFAASAVIVVELDRIMSTTTTEPSNAALAITAYSGHVTPRCLYAVEARRASCDSEGTGNDADAEGAPGGVTCSPEGVPDGIAWVAERGIDGSGVVVAWVAERGPEGSGDGVAWVAELGSGGGTTGGAGSANCSDDRV